MSNVIAHRECTSCLHVDTTPRAWCGTVDRCTAMFATITAAGTTINACPEHAAPQHRC